MITSVVIPEVYRDSPIMFKDKVRSVDLLSMSMHDFYVILGMNWLEKH